MSLEGWSEGVLSPQLHKLFLPFIMWSISCFVAYFLILLFGDVNTTATGKQPEGQR